MKFAWKSNYYYIQGNSVHMLKKTYVSVNETLILWKMNTFHLFYFQEYIYIRVGRKKPMATEIFNKVWRHYNRKITVLDKTMGSTRDQKTNQKQKPSLLDKGTENR